MLTWRTRPAGKGWPSSGGRTSARSSPASGPGPTCFARAGSPGTRRDCVLRTAALTPLVAGFQ
eukprot:9231964-Alexandrium_andersonii.AAC.1